MSVLHEKAVSQGDLLKSEYGAEYCRESVSMTNPVNETHTFPVGTPLDSSGDPLAAANIANVKMLLLEQVTLVDNEVRTVAALARGPATICKDVLPLNDHADAAYNQANFVAALEALTPPIRCRAEPPEALGPHLT